MHQPWQRGRYTFTFKSPWMCLLIEHHCKAPARALVLPLRHRAGGLCATPLPIAALLPSITFQNTHNQYRTPRRKPSTNSSQPTQSLITIHVSDASLLHIASHLPSLCLPQLTSHSRATSSAYRTPLSIVETDRKLVDVETSACGVLYSSS